MHSHDRTMLAKLGFSDPDRGNSDHDKACLYLSREEVLNNLADKLLLRIPSKIPLVDIVCDNYTDESQGYFRTHFGKGKYSPHNLSISAKAEFHLRKGEGQYSTTIGFLDSLFIFELSMKCVDHDNKYVETKFTSFAEVKIERVGIGDLLRQMNLYKSYVGLLPGAQDGRRFCSLPRGFLIAPWDISATEKEALAEAGFDFLKLGAAFQEWKQTLDKPTVSDEL